MSLPSSAANSLLRTTFPADSASRSAIVSGLSWSTDGPTFYFMFNTWTSSCSASFHVPWFRYVFAKFPMLERVCGCSSPSSLFLMSMTWTSSCSKTAPVSTRGYELPKMRASEVISSDHQSAMFNRDVQRWSIINHWPKNRITVPHQHDTNNIQMYDYTKVYYTI